MITAASYEGIFTHNQRPDCLIKSCAIYRQDCSTALAHPVSAYISINAAPPYELSSSENVAAGYSKQICYSCIIENVVGTYTFDDKFRIE